MFRSIAVALLAAAPATAAEWTIRDLGETLRESHCLDAAETALDAEAIPFGGSAPRRRGWSVLGEEVGPGPYEAVILCAHGSQNRTRALLVLRSAAEDALAAASAERIAAEWRSSAQALDKRWMDALPPF